jgi:hypothetical protein
MRDYIGKSRFWNFAPNNPTQTRFTRFMQGPLHAPNTSFSRAAHKFESMAKDAVKNRYSDYLD